MKTNKAKKPTTGTPFRLLSPAGQPVMEGHLVIVPDDETNPPARPFLPGLPVPTIIRRSQMACLTRRWRKEEGTNFPTAGDLMGMVMRRGFDGALLQTLNPAQP